MKYLEKNIDYTMTLDNIILRIDTTDNIVGLSVYIPYKALYLYLLKLGQNVDLTSLYNDRNVYIRVSTLSPKNIKIIPESSTIFDIFPIKIDNIDIKNLFNNGISINVDSTGVAIPITFNKFISNIGLILTW